MRDKNISGSGQPTNFLARLFGDNLCDGKGHERAREGEKIICKEIGELGSNA